MISHEFGPDEEIPIEGTLYIDIDIETPAYASGRVTRVTFSDKPIDSTSAFAVDIQRLEAFGQFQVSHDQLEMAREWNQTDLEASQS
ncbi:MAG: hypothetical protein GY906_10205 [bacterium]|nr:hypothetical protein [bacterium]